MMDMWYNLLEIIPLEWLHHGFMKNALLAILLVTPVFGVLGTMVVSNKMAFFSDSIGHSALTGIALGVILGIKQPLWSMVLFSITLAILISVVKHANSASTDTVISVFSSTMIALGIVILSRQGGFTKYSTYLIGDLLSITPSEIMILAAVALGLLVYWMLMFNKLMLVSMNPSLAGSRGLHVKGIEMFFTVVVAVIVTMSIQWIGILIINSLLILPAAAAQNISRNVRQYHAFSVLIAVLSGIIGLVLSYYWGTATGATIVLVSSMFFAATFALKHKLN